MCRAPQLVDVVDVELGVDALTEEVQGQGDDVDVASAFAVAEQRALDPIGAGHHAKLGGGDGTAAIVVRMQTQDDRVAVFDVAMEPLDHIGVHVGRVHLDRRR